MKHGVLIKTIPEDAKQHPIHLKNWITPDGKVFKYHNEKIYILKGWINKEWGYPMVTVGNKSRPIHQLILETFVGFRPSSNHEARHLDGNSFNSILSNLAWGTKKENGEDRVLHGTSKRNRPTREQCNFTKYELAQLQEVKLLLKQGLSQREIARRTYISATHIGRIAKWDV